LKRFNKTPLLTFLALAFLAMSPLWSQTSSELDDRVLYKIVDVNKEIIEFHYKDQNDALINTLGQLDAELKEDGKELLFGMNGGMFHPDYSPVGLYIEDFSEINRINNSTGKANFNLRPNGVFSIYSDQTAMICTTSTFASDPSIRFATQSGPMLLIDGAFHPAFNKGSKNVNIRNGVGVLPNGNVVLAMSTTFINFYDFALFFKSLGCKNALYLDGAVSQVFYPEADWVQTNRKFGVLISVHKKDSEEKKNK